MSSPLLTNQTQASWCSSFITLICSNLVPLSLKKGCLFDSYFKQTLFLFLHRSPTCRPTLAGLGSVQLLMAEKWRDNMRCPLCLPLPVQLDAAHISRLLILSRSTNKNWNNSTQLKGKKEFTNVLVYFQAASKVLRNHHHHHHHSRHLFSLWVTLSWPVSIVNNSSQQTAQQLMKHMTAMKSLPPPPL